ncbi:MAG TPA: hydrogenase maturation protease [Candidatus Krumholzibacteria bacterium]|nr:hydrogenase maturation protease [Candidatus Krumholzibacteria bacterium]
MRRLRTVVLGLGNPILTDDAVGVRLAGAVKSALGDRPDVTVVEECSVGGLDLLDRLTGYERAIVLDAIRTRGGRPGDCYRFTAAALRDTVNLTNVHDANFATALELGRALGHALPADEDIHVFAVEVADERTFGTELSADLAPRYPACRDLVLAEVGELLGVPLASSP